MNTFQFFAGKLKHAHLNTITHVLQMEHQSYQEIGDSFDDSKNYNYDNVIIRIAAFAGVSCSMFIVFIFTFCLTYIYGGSNVTISMFMGFAASVAFFCLLSYVSLCLNSKIFLSLFRKIFPEKETEGELVGLIGRREVNYF